MKLIKYPKIEQFRKVVYDVKRKYEFVGLDNTGEARFDSSRTKPTLTFSGSVKLHGTNASVCYNKIDGLWMQSKQNIVTIDEGHMGFVKFAEHSNVILVELIEKLAITHNINLEVDTISLFGEWAGKGIQKKVGIANVDKAFFLFGCKVTRLGDVDFSTYWLPTHGVKAEGNRIYNIWDYESYTVDIDFNKPDEVVDHLISLTEFIEKECPVAKSFGIENGVGEGVVWSTEYEGQRYQFKVKGEKHAVVKSDKIVHIDTVKLASIDAFVRYAVTKSRFDQAMSIVDPHLTYDRSLLGAVLKWIVQDIVIEESDTMLDNGLTPKDLNRHVSQAARQMFFENEKSV